MGSLQGESLQQQQAWHRRCCLQLDSAAVAAGELAGANAGSSGGGCGSARVATLGPRSSSTMGTAKAAALVYRVLVQAEERLLLLRQQLQQLVPMLSAHVRRLAATNAGAGGAVSDAWCAKYGGLACSSLQQRCALLSDVLDHIHVGVPGGHPGGGGQGAMAWQDEWVAARRKAARVALKQVQQQLEELQTQADVLRPLSEPAAKLAAMQVLLRRASSAAMQQPCAAGGCGTTANVGSGQPGLGQPGEGQAAGPVAIGMLRWLQHAAGALLQVWLEVPEASPSAQLLQEARHVVAGACAALAAMPVEVAGTPTNV